MGSDVEPNTLNDGLPYGAAEDDEAGTASQGALLPLTDNAWIEPGL